MCLDNGKSERIYVRHLRSQIKVVLSNDAMRLNISRPSSVLKGSLSSLGDQSGPPRFMEPLLSDPYVRITRRVE